MQTCCDLLDPSSRLQGLGEFSGVACKAVQKKLLAGLRARTRTRDQGTTQQKFQSCLTYHILADSSLMTCILTAFAPAASLSPSSRFSHPTVLCTVGVLPPAGCSLLLKGFPEVSEQACEYHHPNRAGVRGLPRHTCRLKLSTGPTAPRML